MERIRNFIFEEKCKTSLKERSRTPFGDEKGKLIEFVSMSG